MPHSGVKAKWSVKRLIPEPRNQRRCSRPDLQKNGVETLIPILERSALNITHCANGTSRLLLRVPGVFYFYRNTVKLIPLEVTQFNMIYTAVNKEHKGIKIDGDKPTETFKIIYNGGRILFTQQRRML